MERERAWSPRTAAHRMHRLAQVPKQQAAEVAHYFSAIKNKLEVVYSLSAPRGTKNMSVLAGKMASRR